MKIFPTREKILEVLEFMLGVVLLLVMIAGVVKLINLLIIDIQKGVEFTKMFRELLANFLLIIIGFDLCLILFTHDVELIPELLCFIIVRKIIGMEKIEVWVLLLDVAAIAGIFAIRKYLLTKKYGEGRKI